MKRILNNMAGRILLLLAVPMALAAVVNALRPSGAIAWVGEWDLYIEAKAMKENIPLVTADQTRRLAREGLTIVLDARPMADYDAGHIPGSIALPFDAVDEHFEGVQIMLTPEQPILTYCSGTACEDSFLLTLFLRDQGYTNLMLYAGGFEDWVAKDFPVEGGP